MTTDKPERCPFLHYRGTGPPCSDIYGSRNKIVADEGVVFDLFTFIMLVLGTKIMYGTMKTHKIVKSGTASIP